MEDQARDALPPGYRFYPSEEVLLRYYLTKKNENREGGFKGSDLIKELDLYDHDPFELPEVACFPYGYGGRKKHWFCYTVKETKRGSRKVKSGFWLRKGRIRDIRDNGGIGNAVLGTRSRFVFYVGNSLKNATKTDWILYEYALVDQILASFVLCRVVNKPHHKNSPSEIGLSCCAEESAAVAVRHVGVQHDGCIGGDVEGKVCDDGFVNREAEAAENPIRCGGEHDDNAAPVSVAQGSQPIHERPSGLPCGSSLFVEAVTSQQQLLSILEEDFIELNDIA
ncbi:unnamed protein product [Sphenostylis stenocarpa]|uniref:NAC domain-containing protein n=1 Tax=Sphenostylis stenocarpa TaxID=92480 RepID=A0AA86TAN4_9FABA|nr:unnamed protein product [Sphenostylis stenocarpa]